MPHALLRPARLLTVLVALAGLLLVPAVDAPQVADAATTDACGARIAKPEGGYWSCSFVDNFSGAKLDTAKWLPQVTALSGFSMNRTCFLSGRGYRVLDGTLRLQTHRTSTFNCRNRGSDWSASAVGGAVSSYTKFDQTYGRFEARIKFPRYSARGLQGGFWMNPTERTYGPWPASGEIDVAEWYSALARHVFPSLHYTGRTAHDTAACLMGDRSRFHTYSVTWSPSRMRFLYDGRLCFSRAWEPTDLEAPKPFDQPFTVALVAAIGAGDNAPSSDTPAWTTTKIDYVKVWH